jgi:glutamine synthetase
MGIKVRSSHHEVAISQHEIDLQYTDALTMADNIMTARLVIKEIAQRHGLYATFMPKPIFGIAGNGMHTHQSLFQNGRNVFLDKSDPYYLSQLARHYTAGLLKHAPEICSVVSQWVNSYKRLVPWIRDTGLRLLGTEKSIGHDTYPDVPARKRKCHSD